MCIIDYGKEIVINILEKTYSTVELDEEDVEIVDEVQMQVISKDMQYWVECYYTGDNEEGSDSYVIRVYDDERGLGNSLLSGDCQIAVSDVDSGGNSYDRGLELKDTKVEEAIMETLFGEDGIIIPF